MPVPFASQDEYVQALLALADGRLTLLETAASQTPAERESAFRLAESREGRLRERCRATVEGGGAAPLEYLFNTFGLTNFERHCVCMSLAAELDSTYEGRYSALQSDGCRLPSLGLCLKCFAHGTDGYARLLAGWREREDHLSFFFRSGHSGADGRGDLTPGLKLDRRIPGFLLDYMSADPALSEAAELYWPGSDGLPPLVLRQAELDKMTSYAALSGRQPLLFYLQGETGSGRRFLARHFCRARGQPLLAVDLPALFSKGETWEEILLPALREAAIRRAALAITGFERLLPEKDRPQTGEDDRPAAGAEPPEALHLRARILLERAARVTDTLFLISAAAWQPELNCGPWRRAELRLDTPDTAGRMLLWSRKLEGQTVAKDAGLDLLAEKFALLPGQIHAAAGAAAELRRWEGAESLTDEILNRACRAQLSQGLGRLAAKVSAAYTWEDLILPPEQKRRLQNACAQVEYRHQVYDRWGFGKKIAYGRGLSMLFSGPPGTGKTMAAQVIANRLGLELYKVDLSGVISKYIGETEKQLGAVFDEVKKSQSILFFDEADALFGKRSETKDSHDRYANVQTSYLLQKMEEYDGIVILASNLLQNFDEAFKRRLKFIIEFTLPDRERREEIWRAVLPPELPRADDLDFGFLARSFELSGSSIKSIAVSAAFLAAAESSPVSMVHLLLAARDEQNKTGKTIGEAEFGEYYHQILTYQSVKNTNLR